MFLREKRQPLGLLGKCLILVRSGSHLIPWRYLARIAAARVDTMPNNSEIMRHLILNTTLWPTPAGAASARRGVSPTLGEER